MTDSQKWLILILLLAIGWVVYLLTPILLPFVISAILAYLGDPLVDWLETLKIKSWKLGRTQSVILVFLTLSLALAEILFIIIPGIESQISLLISKLPVYVQWVNETLIPLINLQLDLEIEPFDSSQLIQIIKEHWHKAGGILANIVGSVSHSGSVIFQWLMNLFLIPVITFYLLRDWDVLVEKINNLLPRRISPTVSKLAKESDQVLGAFLRGQFYVMIGLGAIYAIGLWIIGLELALLIGIISGLVSFIPYLGAIVGIVSACLSAIIQFQDLLYLIPVAIVFVVGQSIESTILTPWLVGDKIGLHPVAVIFAVLSGAQLFGFMGILLALPIASIFMVILRHIHEIYKVSGFYTEKS